MHNGESNTKANPRHRQMPEPEQQAFYISESIVARRSEGKTYQVSEYGIQDNPEMLELVARRLGVIR